MRLIIFLVIFFALSVVADSYVHTPLGGAAQLGYSCGYANGIYHAIDENHLESNVCNKFRALYKIDKDGSK